MEEGARQGGIPRRPRGIEHLKHQSSAVPPAAEYSLTVWIGSASQLLKSAAKLVAADDKGEAKDEDLEEAYMDYRKAALIVRLIVDHPEFKKLLASKTPNFYKYNDVKGSLPPVEKLNAIADKLKAREEAWEAKYGHLGKASPAAGSSQANGQRPGFRRAPSASAVPLIPSVPKEYPIAAGSLPSPPLSPMSRPSRPTSAGSVTSSTAGDVGHPAAGKAEEESSGAPMSIAARMAALRDAGMGGAKAARPVGGAASSASAAPPPAAPIARSPVNRPAPLPPAASPPQSPPLRPPPPLHPQPSGSNVPLGSPLRPPPPPPIEPQASGSYSPSADYPYPSIEDFDASFPGTVITTPPPPRPATTHNSESVPLSPPLELDLRKANNRKAAVVPLQHGEHKPALGQTPPPVPSGYYSSHAPQQSLSSSYTPQASTSYSPQPPTSYASQQQPYPSHYSYSNGIETPTIAVPATAAQRSGVYDGYTSPAPALMSPPALGGYTPQPYANGLDYRPPVAANGLGRSVGPVYHQDDRARLMNSYSANGRHSIDYPTLPQQQQQQNGQPSRPLPQPTTLRSSFANTPPPLAVPPTAKPAPVRSGSTYSTLSLAPYHTQTRYASDIKFGDEAIGLTGLKNLGNTCYMNSTVQALSATIPFARYFKDGSYKKDVNSVNPLGSKGVLAEAVAELVRSLWAESYNFLSPVTFREAICRFAPQFKNNDQHDAQEFLGFLLDGLHEDLNYVINKPPAVEMTPDRERDLETLPPQVMSEREWEIYRRRNDSFVVQCFQGQFRNQMKCLTCSKTSTTYNTFMPLSIPLPANRKLTSVTLHECLQEFVKEEILDKDDAWFCPQCKKHRKASKKLTISRLPPILIIHLKRFSFKGPFSDKIETRVEFPLESLDLTAYVPTPLFDSRSTPLTAPPKGKVYDLYGVCNHFGTLSSGHYTAFVRNHKEWFSVTDSKFSKVEPQYVRSARSAYILYYRLR